MFTGIVAIVMALVILAAMILTPYLGLWIVNKLFCIKYAYSARRWLAMLLVMFYLTAMLLK